MPRVVQVTASSRLHFGLWSLSGGIGRQFGGVGAMVEHPQLNLSIQPTSEFAVSGSYAARASAFTGRWAEFHRCQIPRCQIVIHEAPAQHAGLGTGTQLGLAIAAGLSAFVGLPSQSPQELAISAGRGLRSAVGTFGFVFGGLIVEQGKLPGEPISPLDCRIDLPADWRFVLLRPRGLIGLAGENEADTFGSLPTVPPAVTEELIAEIRDRLVPAAATADFTQFADSLYRYGRLSGESFAAAQGGPYNGPVLTSLVERIRGLGYAGVGQSSWGPTLFVVTPSQQAAELLTDDLAVDAQNSDVEVVISPPCNRGALIEVCNRPNVGHSGP